MLSNRMTFSLTCLIALFAFSLICGVPSVLAHDGDEAHIQLDGSKAKSTVKPHFGFAVKLIAAESMMDVSYRGDGADDNIQIMRSETATETTISLLARFDVVVNLDDPTDANRLSTAVTTDVTDRGTGAFEAGDVIIDAYDVDGRALGILPVAEADDVIELRHRDPNSPGKEFLILIDEGELNDAYSDIHSGGPYEIATLLVSIPAGKVEDATLAEVIRARTGAHVLHQNTYSNVFQVHFVKADAGLAKHSSLAATPVAVDQGVPGVVSIDRILDRSGFTPIETGAFNVRVILTEEPRMGDKSGLTTDMVMVEGGGSVTAVTPGLTYDGGERIVGTTTPTTDNGGSKLTLAMVGQFIVAGATAADNAPAAADTALPNATGRDNKYYTYSVTITPDAGTKGDLTISIKQFMDHVKPVSKMYLPVTPEQRVATTLSAAAEAVRDARVANEMLMVTVDSAGDANVAAATKAYEDRQKVLDGVANEITLANKLYIPAGGYLVLVGDRGKAGIADPKSKTKEKLTAAQKLYNVTGLGLPFPADDLNDFFRNGGTLNLGYADITAATGSGHDDSKGATGDDATGYTAATTNAYAAGALIINEIMWGLDAGGKDSQYIELYNPGATAIGIDNKEWVITVGDLPTGFTAIDAVSNRPTATTYWTAPGGSGVTAASATHPAVMDLVSMSRKMDAAGMPAADGTAEASWAMSVLPSANLSGARVGTPGAMNNYDTTAQDAAAQAEADAAQDAADTADASKAPVASVGDLMITEIMVDTGSSGNLPQWIEISNVSGAAVSLMGWSINVDNDPSDADVLPSLNIQLGDVTVGVGDEGEAQSVLVISKESNRNSGVGTGNTEAAAGMIRSERIINAGLDPHAFLSNMSFRIGLVPPAPQASGAVGRGDVAGNLQQGWELPMAEGNARSSLIRRDMNDKGEVMGTDAAGWVLASTTSHVAIVPYVTYYGDAKDQGSPGIYKAGSALPVELSKFGAKRDPLTGQVVITWETQSELNNAGFFIKRSQQKNSQFVAVNPAMIPGAGTTSEKQSYTYTDTTAKPNIVYYYQIEDVSLDGNRQTLTRAHRLKGHVGAAGKLTTLWGQLKDQE